MKMEKYSLKVLLALILIFLPFLVVKQYNIHILVMSGIFILLALGLDFVIGLLGEISLGHAAFFGIGAYTSAILSTNYNTPFLLDMIAAILATGIFSFFIGYLSLKLKGPYFAIVTFGFAEIVHLVTLNWVDLTRGPMGLAGVTRPKIGVPGLFTLDFDTEIKCYYLVLVLILIACFVYHRIVNSRVGNAILAVRENDDLASSVGIDTARYKMIAFITGMAFAGAAGSFYAHYISFVDPTLLSFHYTSMPIIMVIVGGQASMRGIIIGGAILTVLPEYLRAAQSLRLPIFGLLLILCIIFMPDGINGFLNKYSFSLKRWRNQNVD
jgi:branched-chain amino acid transport system permease protein